MLRKILNQYHANNIQELLGNIFSKMRKEQVPDSYIEEITQKTSVTPRSFEFSEILDANRLADMLPYEWFDKETNIYQTARSHGFVFDCGTLVGCLQDLDDQLKSLFNLGIPDGTCMQVLLLASSELEDKFSQYTSLRQTPLLSKLANSRVNFYRGGLKSTLKEGYKLPVRNFRLVISFTFDGLFLESNQTSLISLQQSIASVLKNCYINNQLMKPNELINLLRELLCTSSLPVEPHVYDERRSIRDQIADIDNNIYVAPDGLCINDMGIKSIAVGRYPDTFAITQCDKFVGDVFSIASQISHPFFITQNVTFLNQSAENMKLQSAAVATAEQVKPGKFTALFPLFHKKHAEYKLLQSVISNGEGLMLMNHTIHVYYPPGQSESAFQEIKSLYKTFGFHMVTNSNLQLPALLCSLPLFHDFSASIEQKRYRMMSLYTQTNVVNLMPLFADSKGTGKPILMYLSPRGQVQFFDFFQSQTNYNASVSAESGAGKSFLVNDIVTSYLAANAKVSIIDVGRSYKKTSEINNGQYIEFTKEAAICINPFSFIKLRVEDCADFDFSKITKDELLALEDLDDQITMLKSIFLVSAGVAEDDPNYSLADSHFEQAIINSLQKYQTNSTFTTVHDELLAIGLNDEKGLAKNLAESIKSYTKHGIFGKYFEGKSNLDIDNSLLVLELEELQSKGNLKFIVLLILMLKITQDMYMADRLQKKICIIDEAWDLMSGGNTGKFIVTGYRRARKYNGSFITITQNIDDYFENATTQACYSNAAIKIMLKQSLPKAIQLDEYTTRLLRSLKSEAGAYSEFIIQIDNNKTLCRFIPDPFSQEMFTTEANEVSLIKAVEQADKLPIEDTLEKVLKIRAAFTKRYRGDRRFATTEILKFINTNGYQSLLNHLQL